MHRTLPAGPAAPLVADRPPPPLLRLRRRARTHLHRALAEPGWLPLFTLGRLMPLRALAGRLRRPAEVAGVVPATLFPALDLPAALAGLRREGIARGLDLPPPVLAELAAAAEAMPCWGDADRTKPLDAAARRALGACSPFVVGDYLETVGEIPMARRVAADPGLRALAAAYLGVPVPWLRRVRLWWSFTGTSLPEARRAGFAQMFHFDLDDWRALKVFFYLTDTTAANGAHEFVRFSHRHRPLSMQLSPFKGCGEGAVRKAFPAGDILTVTGPAGTGFAEDPFGLHRGTLVREGARLMLEVEYGVTRPKGSRGPYGAPDVGVR